MCSRCCYAFCSAHRALSDVPFRVERSVGHRAERRADRSGKRIGGISAGCVWVGGPEGISASQHATSNTPLAMAVVTMSHVTTTSTGLPATQKISSEKLSLCTRLWASQGVHGGISIRVFMGLNGSVCLYVGLWQAYNIREKKMSAPGTPR